MQREYSRRWRARHPERWKNSRKRARDKAREVLQKIALAAKDRPCTDCGVQYPPPAMQFDHVRGEKIKDVSQICASRGAKEMLKVEITKCDVVCANCHAIRTYSRMKELP